MSLQNSQNWTLVSNSCGQLSDTFFTVLFALTFTTASWNHFPNKPYEASLCLRLCFYRKAWLRHHLNPQNSQADFLIVLGIYASYICFRHFTICMLLQFLKINRAHTKEKNDLKRVRTRTICLHRFFSTDLSTSLDVFVVSTAQIQLIIFSPEGLEFLNFWYPFHILALKGFEPMNVYFEFSITQVLLALFPNSRNK